MDPPNGLFSSVVDDPPALHTDGSQHSHPTASTANLVAAVAQAYAREQQGKLKSGRISVGSGSNDDSKGLRIPAGYSPGSNSAVNHANSVYQGSPENHVSAQLLSGAPSNGPALAGSCRTREFMLSKSSSLESHQSAAGLPRVLFHLIHNMYVELGSVHTSAAVSL